MSWKRTQLLVVSAILLWVSFQSVQGQEDSTAVKGRNFMGKGAKMARFGIGSLSKSNDFDIMAGYYVTDKIALRLDYLPMVFVGSETITRSFDDSTYADTHSEQTDSDHFINITAHYMTYPTLKERVSFFYGIGPRLSIDYDFQVRKFFDNSTGRNTYYVWARQIGWGLGLSGIFGVEWFARDWIGLFCDYGVQVSYTWSRYKWIDVKGGLREERNSSGFSFGTRGILAGVTAYF